MTGAARLPGSLGPGTRGRAEHLPGLGAVGLAALGLYFIGVNEILILFGGAIVVLLAHVAQRWSDGSAAML